MPVVRADPGYRQRVVAAFAAAIVLGAIGLLWGRPALTAWLERQPPRDAVRAMQIIFACAFAPAFPMAFSMARLARRIRAKGQFPPPGMKVMVDTEVVTGPAAGRQARAFLALAVVLCLAGLIGMIALPIIISRVVGAR